MQVCVNSLKIEMLSNLNFNDFVHRHNFISIYIITMKAAYIYILIYSYYNETAIGQKQKPQNRPSHKNLKRIRIQKIVSNKRDKILT